ncbi:MAG: membrane dipeptidase [Alcanivoracaceae bacterium]|nr:membrane dipeptidase [Alcanivoracaceae bacterium]
MPTHSARSLIATLVVLCSLPLSTTTLAGPAEDAVYQLAQQCVAIRSPGTGKYLRNNLDVFSFSTGDVNQAEKFFIKPARLGDFLLTDRSGRYLTSMVPQVEGPFPQPGMASEWNISAQQVASNSFRFKLNNRFTFAPIQYEYMQKITRKFLWFTYHTWEPRIDRHFDLVARTDCKPYPEITTNVRGNTLALKGDINAPVRGYVDAHTHITSYEFMGGRVMHGAPFHKYGVPWALDDSARNHGPNGSLDLIGNLLEYGDPTFRYDTRGWPDFPFWPNARQKTHTGYYHKWIERAWLSGMRMNVTLLVENQVLCIAQSTINPAGWLPKNSCNTMDSIRLQAKRIYEMQDYIDAQAGGPGKGFFRVVTSPAQARQVIADGKLAVVMGVEASETLNCGVKDYCDISKIEQGLNELYQLGVRAIFPAHKSDNQFSGGKVENGFVNLGQALATGHYFETKRCDEHTRGKAMDSGLPVIGEVPVINDLLVQVGASPSYDDHDDHCNTRALTPFGVYLVNRMIDLNMIIDLDHLSADATSQVMDIAEARNYSGVVSSHSFMHGAKDGTLHRNFKRMLNAGGFAAHYMSNVDGARDRFPDYLDAVAQTPYLLAMGIGTDTSGLAAQPGPRSNPGDPLVYPFTTEFGTVFDRQKSGNRTFDLNNEGMAHYGLLPDLIEDIRQRTDSRIYEGIMNSAEGYLQMWERAESNNNAQHVNPL